MAEKNMEIKKYIGIYDNVVPYEILSNLIKYCNFVNFEDTKVVSPDGINLINKKVRDVQGKNLVNIKTDSLTEMHWFNFLAKIFNETIKHYINDKKLLDCKIKSLNSIILLKYQNTGFYNWHVDHGTAVPRTLSMIFLLNNDYEGGDLCFKEGDGSNEITIDKRPNRIVIWPSNFLYPHTVKPVTKGTRYSVVCWAL